MSNDILLRLGELRYPPHDQSADPYADACEDAREEIVALRARVAELEAAVRALRDAAEASDDSLYGTLGTGFVRSVVDGALGLSPTLALTKRDGHCLRCGSRAR